MEKESSATPAILVVILVIIVGFVVWYVMDQRGAPETNNDTSGGSLQINVGGSASGDEEPAQ